MLYDGGGAPIENIIVGALWIKHADATRQKEGDWYANDRLINLGCGVARKADAPPRSSPWLLLLKTKPRIHSPAARRPITRLTLPQTTDPSWPCWRCWPLQHSEGCSALVQGCFVLRNCLSINSCSPCRLTVRRQPHHCTSHYLSYKSFTSKVFRLTYLCHRHSSLPSSHHHLSGTHHSSNRQPPALHKAGQQSSRQKVGLDSSTLHPPPNASPVSLSVYSPASRLALACEHYQCQALDIYPSYRSTLQPYPRILPCSSQILPPNPTT